MVAITTILTFFSAGLAVAAPATKKAGKDYDIRVEKYQDAFCNMPWDKKHFIFGSKFNMHHMDPDDNCWNFEQEPAQGFRYFAKNHRQNGEGCLLRSWDTKGCQGNNVTLTYDASSDYGICLAPLVWQARSLSLECNSV